MAIIFYVLKEIDTEEGKFTLWEIIFTIFNKFTKRNYFPHVIETIFIELFVPKTISSNQAYESWYIISTTFSNKLFRKNEHFYKLDNSKKEICTLISMFLRNGRLQFRILSHMMYGNTKNFVYFFSLKQQISCPACTRCSSSR